MIINCKMSRLLENGCCTRVLKLFVTGFYTYVLRVNLPWLFLVIDIKLLVESSLFISMEVFVRAPSIFPPLFFVLLSLWYTMKLASEIRNSDMQEPSAGLGRANSAPVCISSCIWK